MAQYVTFNYNTKYIEITKAPVLEGAAWVIDIDFKIDIYSDGKEDWNADTEFQKFDYPVSAVGGEPLPGSKKLGSTFFISPDWKIKPYEGDHTLRINGNLYSEDGESPYVGTDGVYNVMVINSVSNLVDSTVQQLKEIEYSTFQNNSGWLDVNNITGNAISGIDYPAGNREYPSDTIDDLFAIIHSRGLNNITVIGDAVFTTGHDLIGHTIYGENPLRTTVHIEGPALASNVEFIEMMIDGTLDGGAIIRNCLIGNLNYFFGYIVDSAFSDATLTLAGNADAKLMNCQSDTGKLLTIDLGSSGQQLSIDEFFGHIKLTNFSGTTEHVHINMNGGSIEIDSTCTSGTIILGGYAELTDNSTGTLTIDNRLISTSGAITPADLVAITDSIWNAQLSNYTAAGTSGAALGATGYIEKAIFVDTDALVNGDGTAGSPFDNIGDAKDFAEDNGIKEIVVYSEITLNSNFKNFIVRGLAAPVVDTNGQDCSGSEFYHCTMRGSYTTNKPIVVQESVLDDGFQLTGYFETCTVNGTMNVVGSANVINCTSAIPGLLTPTFNMNSGLASTLSVRNWSGGILVQNMDHASDIATVEMAQGRVFLDNTNVDGLISIRGLAFFDDTSAGTIVETSALFDPSKTVLLPEEEEQLFAALTEKRFIGLQK